MLNYRTYGPGPYKVGLVHGGPGAGGEMAPVARELAARGFSILEPIQTATTLDEQVEELRCVLEKAGALPVILVGYSWGAWLVYILAARYPQMARKLILVGSGPFEAHYVEHLHATRMSRLTDSEGIEFNHLLGLLNAPESGEKDETLARLGALATKADAYDLLEDPCLPSDRVELRGDTFQSVWSEAARMRKEGELLTLGSQIKVPVTAIHGRHDPHPGEGVKLPLSEVLEEFKFIWLEECGHTPWRERQAYEDFYRILGDEIEK